MSKDHGVCPWCVSDSLHDPENPTEDLRPCPERGVWVCRWHHEGCAQDEAEQGLRSAARRLGTLVQVAERFNDPEGAAELRTMESDAWRLLKALRGY